MLILYSEICQQKKKNPKKENTLNVTKRDILY